MGKILSTFSSRETAIPYNLLTEEDVRYFIDLLIDLPNLDDYWINVFLSNSSKYYASYTINFFMKRIEYSVKSDRYDYNPLNSSLSNDENLHFRESSEFNRIMHELLSWIKKFDGNKIKFFHEVAKLLKIIFINFDKEFINFFTQLTDLTSKTDFVMTSSLLREAGDDFIFENREFVSRYLEKAESYGNECYEITLDDLFSSTFYGIRSSSLGQPSQKDIKIKEKSEEILKNISDFSSAYPLYKRLKENAELNITSSIKKYQYLEEEYS